MHHFLRGDVTKWLRVLLVWATMLSAASGILVTGSFVDPSGKPLTGSLVIWPVQGQSIDTCNSSIIVGSAKIAITNGSMATTNIPSSLCLSPQQPYTVWVYNGTKLIDQTRWWVVKDINGVTFQPSAGNRFMHPALAHAYVMLPGDYRKASKTDSFTSFQSKALQLVWERPFKTTAYTVACELDNELLSISSITNLNVVSATVTVQNDNSGTRSTTVFCHARYN